MRIVELLQPGAVLLGPGCARRCPEWLAARGLRRVFLVVSPETLPLAERVFASREPSLEVFDGVRGEPDLETFHNALEAARSAAPQAVVGLGGGSVLDVAKLVAALLDGRQSLQETFGIGRLRGRALPLACLPTTAGTGSEASPNAVLLDPEAKLKKAVISPWLMPDAAFVDAELAVTLPPAVTAYTALDALTHCIETFANRNAHPAVDLYAREGIRLIAAHLERAFRDGADLEARDALARASFYGGLCLGPVNTAAVHALAYPLNGEFHVPHGLSNALLLAPVLRFNLEAAPERYAQVALALGVEPGPTPRATALAGVERLQALCRSVGIPPSLADAGVPREAIPRMAEAALTITRLLANNLREVTRADAEAIYREAFGSPPSA